MTLLASAACSQALAGSCQHASLFLFLHLLILDARAQEVDLGGGGRR